MCREPILTVDKEVLKSILKDWQGSKNVVSPTLAFSVNGPDVSKH